MAKLETVDGFKETEIGLIPAEWKTVALGSVCNFQGGTQPPKKEFIYEPKVGYVRLLQIRDFATDEHAAYVHESHKLRMVASDDILIGRYGASVAKILRGKEGAINVAIMRTLPLEEYIEKGYLYFLLQHSRFQNFVKSLGGRAAQAGFNQGEIKSLLIPLPPIEEQRRIARVLTTIQSAIEKQEAVIAHARQLKRSLMHRLFTYGPYADPLPTKDTEIGEIPETWELRKLGDVARVQGGFAFKSRDYISSGIAVFRISNVSFGKTSWSDAAFIPTGYADELPDYLLKPNDVVMAMTRPVVSGGIKVARISEADTPCLLNQRVCRFLENGLTNSDYFYQLLFSKHFVDSISGGATGSHQPNISAGKIEQIVIPIAPTSEQNRIASILKAVDAKVYAEENSSYSLQELFSSTLEKLMTGRIRVKDLELPQ